MRHLWSFIVLSRLLWLEGFSRPELASRGDSVGRGWVRWQGGQRLLVSERRDEEKAAARRCGAADSIEATRVEYRYRKGTVCACA